MAGKTPVLIMIQGQEPGARWKLRETRVTTIGRSSRNQISLVSPSVSRFHCEVSYVNGLWYVVDLNSKKGTFLNGRRIAERQVLSPGDVLRLSRNLLKFDLVDESAEEDEALVAIREASLGTEVVTKEEGRVSLEEVRLRHQIAVDSGERMESKRSLGDYVADLKLVIGIGVGVALVVGGGLGYAYHVAGDLRRKQEKRQEEAEIALARASALVGAGPARGRAALDALRRVVRSYPDQPAAEEAARMYRGEEGEWLDLEMARIAASEQAGDYQDALERSGDLLVGLSAEALKSLVRERQQFTVRLAHVAFRRVDEEAERLRQLGRTEAAVELYRKAIARIGVPELIRKAEAKLREIRPPTVEPQAGPPAAFPPTASGEDGSPSSQATAERE